MQGDKQVRCRLDVEGLTCSMIMSALRKPGSTQGYTQVKRRLEAGYMQVGCRLAAEGLTCSMIMTELRKPGPLTMLRGIRLVRHILPSRCKLGSSYTCI